MCEINGIRVKKLINAETDQKGYAWAKWYKNRGDDIEKRPECIKFKPNKLKFKSDNNKWYHYDFAPELVSKTNVFTKMKCEWFKTKINIVEIEVLSIEQAQDPSLLGRFVENKLIKRSVYKNGIFKFIMLKLLVMKYCSYIREKTWKPGSVQYQMAKERFNLLK
jgi:hypothetical protein